MGRIKSFTVGITVAVFNIGTAAAQIFRPERCTGSCGSCGFSCVNSAVGLVGIGALIIVWKKLKGKFNNRIQRQK